MKTDYFKLACTLARTDGAKALKRAVIQNMQDEERDSDHDEPRESADDRELALFDRAEARAYNSGAW